MDPRVGSQLGAYRIEGVLGRGGMGVVYLAEHVRLRKKIALKVLPPDLADDAEFRLRFERESQVAASLDHPNIVTVHDAGEADGLLYIAMRYVEGSDLAALIHQEGALPVERALAILAQAAEGLDEAHARGLVHRDVKPANILLAPSPRGGDRVYLSDFGLAKEWAGTRMTKTGYFVGTIHYSPPEQFRAESLDGRTDVYSLGCVLFECLTGRVPFDRQSDPAVMYAHLQDPPPSASALRPGLSPSIDPVVATAMAKEKEKRYPTCGELARAASGVLERGAEPALPTTREPPATVPSSPGAPTRRTEAGAPTREHAATGTVALPRGRRRARSWWVAAVAVVVLAAVAAGGYLLVRSLGEGPGAQGGNGPIASEDLLRPDLVTASATGELGQDACQPPNVIPFDPERVVDGKPDTAWRVEGDGIGESLTLAWNGRVHITRIGLLPGYAKVDRCDGTDRFPQNRVIEEVEYRFDDGSTLTQTFDRRPEVQYMAADVVTGTVTITITETSPPGGRDNAVISEVEVYGAPAA